MVKIIVILLGSLVALILLVMLIGYALPRNHRASCSARFALPPEALWEVVSRRADAGWRSDLKLVELLSDDGDLWKETNTNGDVITFRVEESQPPRRLVTRIDDDNLPFGGSWTYQFVADGTGTHLTITEDGEVYSPIFRFVSHFFMDSSASLRTYLTDLDRHLGSDSGAECASTRED